MSLRLFTESNDVTFERVVEIATSVEQAAVQAKHMKTDPIHNMKGKQQPFKQSPTCHKCGGPHLAPACCFLHERCRVVVKFAILPRSVAVKTGSPNQQSNLPLVLTTELISWMVMMKQRRARMPCLQSLQSVSLSHLLLNSMIVLLKWSWTLVRPCQ